MNDIVARLEALAASPREWRVTTRYECGKVRTFDAHSEAAANNHAVGERRKIGRELIDRAMGKKVRVVDVIVSKI